MVVKKLKFKIGDNYKSKVENIDEFSESIFKEIYKKSYESIAEIMKINDVEKKKERAEKEHDHEDFNNIIAFIGDRGTGKTSCMISLAKSLKEKKDKKEKIEEILGLGHEIMALLIKKKFYLTRVIDPSHLTKNSNILENILADMFRAFKEELEDSKKDINQDEKRKVLKSFTEVYENLKTINLSKEKLFEKEGIDALLKLSSSNNLRRNIMRLVNEYLKFMNGGSETLVIQIDDIDLNTRHAYEMVEQIRKYLIIPNVIILMAVKLEQLSDIITQKYLKEYKESIDKENIKLEDVSHMTEKYLEKLIPIERRNDLPDMLEFSKDIQLEMGGRK